MKHYLSVLRIISNNQLNGIFIHLWIPLSLFVVNMEPADHSKKISQPESL